MSRPTRLDAAAVTTWLASHPNWVREGEAITSTYKLADFPTAIAFVVKVGMQAQKVDHHPDIAIAFDKVTLSFSTHDAGGLTALDLEGAHGADSLA
ncbi:4a-hydroxytetrahydrobiopterin dehydratase [soil metagenome]